MTAPRLRSPLRGHVWPHLSAGPRWPHPLGGQRHLLSSVEDSGGNAAAHTQRAADSMAGESTQCLELAAVLLLR